MIGPFYVTSNSKRYAAWGPPCADTATGGRVTIDGRTFACHPNVVPAFEAWEAIRSLYGYRLTGNDTGFYVCRHMRWDESLPMSTHSWGRSMDVNWLENPAGNKLVTDIPAGMIVDLHAVRTNSGARVFLWGADWDWDGLTTDHSYVDAMHWEVVAHPLDLATGIDPDTLPKETQMAIRVTNPLTAGKAVEDIQLGLLAWDPNSLPRWGADGEYGTESEEAVRRFQGDYGLPVTGVADGVTVALLVNLAGDTPVVDLPNTVTVSFPPVTITTAPASAEGEITYESR